MLIREWTLVNAITRKAVNPKKVYTAINTSRETALAKLKHHVTPALQCFVGLKRGGIVDI